MTQNISAIIIVAKDHQDEEYVYPYYRLQEVECLKLDVVTPDNLAAIGKYGIAAKPTTTWESAYQQKYDLVVIPGGWSPERLRLHKPTIDFVSKAYNLNSIMAAICHGPQVFISAGFVGNKSLTGYVGIREDILNAGAIYIPEEIMPVVECDGIITAAHYRQNPAWLKTIIKNLNIN